MDKAHATFVFDIHGVLFKTDYKELFLCFMRSPLKYRLILHALYLPVWYHIFVLRWNRQTFQECILRLCDRYSSLRPCISLFIEMANSQKPIASTITWVRQLHNSGYSLHILSNIGQLVFDDLLQKFPDVFSHFSVIQTMPGQLGVKGKPHISVFQDYLVQHNVDRKQVVFIDDKMENIVTALSIGMSALYFNDAIVRDSRLLL